MYQKHLVTDLCHRFKVMKYSECPICQKKVSHNTLLKVGKCNNCVAEKAFQKYIDNTELIEAGMSEREVSVLQKAYYFLKRSDKTFTFKNRVMIDLKRILQKGLNFPISNVQFTNKYLEYSKYTSPNHLEIMTITLFSCDFLYFERVESPWTVYPLDTFYQYTDEIIEYYFDSSKCSDCGTKLTRKSHDFCDSCMDRRVLRNMCSEVHINSFLTNQDTIELYKDFINFLLKRKLGLGYITNLLKFERKVFKLLDSEKTNSNIVPFTRDRFATIYSYHWITNACNKVIAKGISLTEEKNIRIFIGHLIAFGEYKEYFLEREDIPKIELINNRLNIFSEKESVENIIFQRIDKLPKSLQPLISSYFQIEFIKREVLDKKNASRTIKHTSIHSKFVRIMKFMVWCIDKKINSWNDVTQEIVDEYLIEIDSIKTRELEKRLLFNFFDYGEKKNMLFRNPIPQFIARDFMMNNGMLPLEKHRTIIKTIKILAEEIPRDSLLLSFCYYHALTSSEIRNLKLSHINAEQQSIEINGRPKAYLSEIDFKALIIYLDSVSEERKAIDTEWLFFSTKYGKGVKISGALISRRAKEHINLTPKALRIGALHYCAEKFGSEYLHDCFGLSLTQSARYGDVNDWIIEDIIRDVVDEDLRL